MSAIPSDLLGGLVRKYFLFLIGWSVLVGSSLTWTISQESQKTLGMATATARTNIEKDIIFRKWVALHGGVYIKPTKAVPPNPYLKIPNRDVHTTDGMELTLMNPAYALRELQSLEGNNTTSKSHLTSLNPINPRNLPDEWEADALKRFESGAKEVMGVQLSDGQSYLRLMAPFIVEADCLKCHEQQGYKLGDIRGGVSTTVSLAPFMAEEKKHNLTQMVSHGLIWMVGLFGMGAFYRREQLFDAERKRMEDEVRQLAFYDALTGLPNRRLLHDRLTRAIVLSKRSGRYGAVMFLDLDNFKPLNDEYGHAVGDLLLIEVAKRLTSGIREVDTVARFGGDEFVVIINELETEAAEATAHAGNVAEKILAMLSAPYEMIVPDGIGTRMVVHHCSACIGVVVFSNHGSGQEELLKWADKAMYQAKAAGRSSVRFYGQ
jgi:diguanylate cyclase (GGDEF)-like protein